MHSNSIKHPRRALRHPRARKVVPNKEVVHGMTHVEGALLPEQVHGIPDWAYPSADNKKNEKKKKSLTYDLCLETSTYVLKA